MQIKTTFEADVQQVAPDEEESNMWLLQFPDISQFKLRYQKPNAPYPGYIECWSNAADPYD